MVVRPASEADLPSILEIENREIAEGYAHFGLVPLTLEEIRSSLSAAGDRFPWMVAEDGHLLGFTRCSGWKSRDSYRWTVEVGVYVRAGERGKGVGRALYHQMFPAMRECGIRTVLAGIALPNPASVRLHESFGMRHAGTLPSVGFKLNRWIDVGYWAVHWGPPPSGEDAQAREWVDAVGTERRSFEATPSSPPPVSFISR